MPGNPLLGSPGVQTTKARGANISFILGVSRPRVKKNKGGNNVIYLRSFVLQLGSTIVFLGVDIPAILYLSIFIQLGSTICLLGVEN